MFSSEVLLEKHRKAHQNFNPEKLIFEGVDHQDVYNISAPFILNGQHLIAGRIENRSDEFSKIGLFTRVTSNTWRLLQDAISLDLQDPFIIKIKQDIILGGVKVIFDGGKVLKWRTDFYKLSAPHSAKFLFSGPWGMKDIRMLALKNDQILILTRPQGDIGGLGKIGMLIVNDLSSITKEMLATAPLLHDQYLDTEWGGANEIHLIHDKVCVLAHIGSRDKQNQLHYRAMTFELSQDFRHILNPKIIAERKDFVPGPAKRPDLEDVVFSGGLIFKGEKAVLYAGTGDTEAQKIIIDNPFR